MADLLVSVVVSFQSTCVEVLLLVDSTSRMIATLFVTVVTN